MAVLTANELAVIRGAAQGDTYSAIAAGPPEPTAPPQGAAVSDRIDCAQQCTIPDGVELAEVPRPRHAWSDVFSCPNDGCVKSFLARQTAQPETDDA